MLTTQTYQAFIAAYAERLEELKGLLNDLDNRIGDGDHGTNMARGFRAAAKQVVATPADDVGLLCNTTAMTLLANVGGASGPLYATVFMRFAAAWKGKTDVQLTDMAGAFSAALEGLEARGKAAVGDKTMIDVWAPFASAAIAMDECTAEKLRSAVSQAAKNAVATKEYAAKRGRAAYVGERSIGICDPGSISSAVFFEEWVDALVGGVKRSEWPTLASS